MVLTVAIGSVALLRFSPHKAHIPAPSTRPPPLPTTLLSLFMTDPSPSRGLSWAMFTDQEVVLNGKVGTVRVLYRIIDDLNS
ncbi:MAG: hypothetical protein M3T55_10545, partial [Pseudomonadota bacterium]|nr:hypothetical protein [Pseudomonadota bacterium]